MASFSAFDMLARARWCTVSLSHRSLGPWMASFALDDVQRRRIRKAVMTSEVAASGCVSFGLASVQGQKTW